MVEIAIPRCFAAIFVGMIVQLAAPAPVGAAAVKTRPALAKLVKDTRTLSKRVVAKTRTRAKLLRFALAARRAARAKPCSAVAGLKAYQRLLPRKRNRRIAEAVGTLRADAAA